MYFITIRCLQPKNKLQEALQQYALKFKHTLTEKTQTELQGYFQGIVAQHNEVHKRCSPVKMVFSNDTSHIYIGLGEETGITFTKAQGTVASNFNIQTQI